MAITQVGVDTPSGLTKYRNSDSNGTKAAVKASSGSIHAIIIDNSANAAASYVKLWDSASGDVTVGTTAPDWVFKVPASTKVTLNFTEAIAFGTALTEASVTTAGTAGTTGPTSDVVLTIIYV